MPSELSTTLVHVVDDDEAMRESLEFLLESHGYAVKLYEAAQPLVDVLPSLANGCVLTDIRMPGMDGIELLRHVRESHEKLPVIVMTAHGEVPLAVEAMKLGASDFLEKPFDDELLLEAIRNATARSLLEQTDPAVLGFIGRLETLTRRERQVFDRLVAGDPNKVIARHLEISPRTVEIYRANVMTKMQAGSLSELVRSAVRAQIA